MAREEMLTPRGPLELEAFVGPGAALLGKFSFTGTVRVDGRFEGELLGGRAVIVGPGAEVIGTIVARSVIVLGGRVTARIVARESIELIGNAKVHGDVVSPNVEMGPEVEYLGRCEKRPVEDAEAL